MEEGFCCYESGSHEFNKSEVHPQDDTYPECMKVHLVWFPLILNFQIKATTSVPGA